MDHKNNIPITASIVIPCFNEGERLRPFLNDLCEVFAPHNNIELIVVDDGSQQTHAEATDFLVRELHRTKRELRLLRLPINSGKGAAIAAGFQIASHGVVGFVDADGSVSAQDCLRLLRYFFEVDELQSAALIGSRVKMLGRFVDRKLRRHLIGRVFATYLSTLFDIPIYDSQCGCKFFRTDVMRSCLPFVQSTRWLWDTELVLLLYLTHQRITEVPVDWKEVPGSKVSLIADPVRMFFELLGFRRYLRKQGRFPRAKVVMKDAASAPESRAKAPKPPAAGGYH